MSTMGHGRNYVINVSENGDPLRTTFTQKLLKATSRIWKCTSPSNQLRPLDYRHMTSQAKLAKYKWKQQWRRKQ